MADKMTIIKQKITPEVATQMLATNIDRNRPISLARVEMYEHDMLSGKWLDNGETIKIDREGRLIDGQHRLRAIERSGVTLWMWVAHGVASNAFETVDVGLTRTPRQLFNMSNDPLKHYRTISAVAGFAFRVFMGISNATQSQKGEFVESNRTTLEWLYGSVKGATEVSVYYLVTAIAMHLHGVPDVEINGFINGATRADFDPKKSTTVFRYCVQAENSRQKLRSFKLANLQNMERCAYSYANNMQRFTVREDPYPIAMDEKYKLHKA